MLLYKTIYTFCYMFNIGWTNFEFKFKFNNNNSCLYTTHESIPGYALRPTKTYKEFILPSGGGATSKVKGEGHHTKRALSWGKRAPSKDNLKAKINFKNRHWNIPLHCVCIIWNAFNIFFTPDESDKILLKHSTLQLSVMV